jgi:hypothetical protein
VWRTYLFRKTVAPGEYESLSSPTSADRLSGGTERGCACGDRACSGNRCSRGEAGASAGFGSQGRKLSLGILRSCKVQRDDFYSFSPELANKSPHNHLRRSNWNLIHGIGPRWIGAKGNGHFIVCKDNIRFPMHGEGLEPLGNTPLCLQIDETKRPWAAGRALPGLRGQYCGVWTFVPDYVRELAQYMLGEVRRSCSQRTTSLVHDRHRQRGHP